MSMEDDVTAAMKTAMRARDKDTLRAVRNIRAAFLSKRKEDGVDALSDDDAIAVLRRMAKQLAESVQAFAAAGREDLEVAERAELAVVNAYLPQLADEATTRQWVENAVAASGASTMSDIGKVMGSLMRAHKGEMDGGLANKLARELLS